jgi:hypothetical protein
MSSIDQLHADKVEYEIAVFALMAILSAFGKRVRCHSPLITDMITAACIVRGASPVFCAVAVYCEVDKYIVCTCS